MAAVLKGVTLQDRPLALIREVAEPSGACGDFDDALAKAHAEGFEAGRAEEARRRDEQWASDMDAARARARQEGRSEGLDEGLREAAARGELLNEQTEVAARERLRRLNALVDSISKASDAWRTHAEEDMVALAHEIACRVLGPRAIERRALEQMASQLLLEYGARPSLEVHVHPEDFEHLLRSAPSDSAASAWKWVADTDVVCGGVVLRSSEGTLDARLSTQFQALREVLATARQERGRPGEVRS